jgi:hypothetical protein
VNKIKVVIIQKIRGFFNIKFLLSLIVLLGLFILWVYKGITETAIHADLARDLNYLSNLWMHKVVWLGPATSANFPASPLYFYLLFPGLLLSGGNGLSLVFSQSFFAALALGLFAYFQVKKSFISTLLVILVVGLSPWWITASALPWNGHMYVAWVFLALTSLWFKTPFFISALLFGISIAIDLAAILVLPILFYEWLVNVGRKKNLIYIFVGLLLPWAPIIIFEIITNGFLTRQWLQYPAAAGITYSPNLTNIKLILNLLKISQVQAITILIISFLIASNRARYWLIFICSPLLFIVLVTPLRDYYLLGFICALTFIFSVILASKTIGRIILVIFIIIYILGITILPFTVSNRSIIGMSNTVDTFMQQSNLDKNKKYAVVSVRDLQNSTPQADDYRFFLRTKGINVLNIDQYSEADILILFIEVPNFKWENFEDWHINRFGNREYISNQNINGVEIIIYKRK